MNFDLSLLQNINQKLFSPDLKLNPNPKPYDFAMSAGKPSAPILKFKTVLAEFN